MGFARWVRTEYAKRRGLGVGGVDVPGHSRQYWVMSRGNHSNSL